MHPVEFSSVLPEEFKGDVEHLLFFNPLQARARAGILQSIERYGHPRVYVESGCVRVAVGDVADVQTLYALAVEGDSCELVGVAVYTREADTLTILHLSVAEGATAAAGGEGLALQLAAAIREVGSRVKGIGRVLLPYGIRSQQRLRTPEVQRPRVTANAG